ncbi:Acetylcholinesterase [Folsomia candida]|uniref:Carboxylic ester hydrolase n=1 Tax=Folsomia candida TaxID=158441 RepID=A0A226F6B5_FOLCA|nr:Acetylcholinesterase [Folsomia candida]
MSNLSRALCVVLIFVIQEFAVANQDGESVYIQGVGRIRGFTTTSPNGVLISNFLGIPYGKQPYGFSPITDLTGDMVDFDANAIAICAPDNMTENCLTLSVDKPRTTDMFLPVLVKIHGGSFKRWTASMFNGDRLIDNHPMVVVSVNYRIGILGFLTLDFDEAPGNLGLLDQLTALEWIKSYIHHFRGDPNNITLYGESAGSASVAYLADSSLTKDRGLFHRVIQSSGDNCAGWTINFRALEQSKAFAINVGCDYETNLDIVNCLRGLTIETILAGYNDSSFYTAPSIQDNPLVSDVYRIVPKHPLDNDPEQTRSRVPLLIGGNRNDGTFLLSRYVEAVLKPNNHHLNVTYLRNIFLQTLLNSSHFGINDTPIGMVESIIASFLKEHRMGVNLTVMGQAVSDIYSTFYFKAPALHKAKSHALLGLKTYLYSYEYESSTHVFYEDLGGIPEILPGVTHADELNYIFKFKDFSEEEKLFSERLINTIYNFMMHGDPGAPDDKEDLNQGPIWTPVTNETFGYTIINFTMRAGSHYGQTFHTV